MFLHGLEVRATAWHTKPYSSLLEAAFMESEPAQPEGLVVPAKKSRIGSLMGIQIVGVGSGIPENRVHNDDLAVLGYDAQWIVQRSGIIERRHAPPAVATSDLAIEASEAVHRTLRRRSGRYRPRAFGHIHSRYVAARHGLDCPQDRLGLRAPAFDLQAACASFILAMITGAQYVATGCRPPGLVIGADCAFREC